MIKFIARLHVNLLYLVTFYPMQCSEPGLFPFNYTNSGSLAIFLLELLVISFWSENTDRCSEPVTRIIANSPNQVVPGTVQSARHACYFQKWLPKSHCLSILERLRHTTDGLYERTRLQVPKLCFNESAEALWQARLGL